MAWLNEQTWFTYSSNIRLIGNIEPLTITHTGSNLRVQGTIAAGARGSNNYSFYYLDYTSYAQPEGGSKIALGAKGRTWKVGSEDVHVSFDVTLSNVPATATSRSFYVNFYGPNTNSVKATLYWTINFSASGSAPEGLYVTYNDSAWNSVSFTSGASSWGGLNAQNHTAMFVGSTNGDAASYTDNTFGNRPRYEWYHDGSQDTAWSFTGTQANASGTLYTPIGIKGLTHYKLGIWGDNGVWRGGVINQTLRYLPPAPCTMTYTDPGGDGTKVYPVVFSGVADNNQTTYDAAELTRTVRYKVEGAADWTYVENATEALVDAETTFTVSVPGSKNVTIEGWMTYHGLQSEVKTLTLYNGNAPSRVYGPVDGKSKLAVKLYGPVDGKSKNIVKLYGSVDGKSKAILG